MRCNVRLAATTSIVINYMGKYSHSEPGRRRGRQKAVQATANHSSYLDQGAPDLRLPRPSVRVAQERSPLLVGTGWWTPHSGGALRGGEDGVEAEHSDEQHSHKRNRYQKGFQAGVKYAVVHDRLTFPEDKNLLIQSMRLSDRD